MLPIIKKNQTGYGQLIENDGFISPADNKQFITEMQSKSFESFSEVPVLYAVMQKYGVRNGNGRIYPKDVLIPTVEKYKELIKFGAAAGEADHPESVVISTRNIALQVLDLWWDGATLMGKIKLPVSKGFLKMGIVSCPADLMANHIMHGIQLGVSSRGVGSVEDEGGEKIVQDDFELVCWDMVTNPSTSGAWTFLNQDDTKPFITQKVEEEIKYSKSKNKVMSAMDNFLRKYS